MAFNINEFRAALRYGGARSSLFQVKLTNPVNGAADQAFSFMCRAASVPERTLNQLPVPYFGRNIKVAGSTQNYADWNVSIINDEDYAIRNALEEWSHAINAPIGNVRMLPTSEQSLYKTIADVTHYSQTGQKLREYKFNGIWPMNIAAMNLDWGSEEVTSFDVTFSVDYWTIGEASTTGFAGGVAI